MRENKATQLRNLTVEELGTKLRSLREDLFNLRFRNSVAQLDNALKVRMVRRDVARIETVLTEHRQGIRAVAAEKRG